MTPRASLIQLCSLREFIPNRHALWILFFNCQAERDKQETQEASVFHTHAIEATDDHV